MRFMIIVKATPRSEAETRPDDFDPEIMAAMAAYHQELAAAGVLLDGNGLRPSRDGWRIRYRQGQPSVVDGPFAEVKELIAGYTLIQVPSREAALAWSRRFPSPSATSPAKWKCGSSTRWRTSSPAKTSRRCAEPASAAPAARPTEWPDRARPQRVSSRRRP